MAENHAGVRLWGTRTVTKKISKSTGESLIDKTKDILESNSDARDQLPDQSIRAQAHLHHAYFLGLQLMVSVNKGASVMGDWMFRLFRKQHEDKFLSSFDKLGLNHLPHAVACARYHVMSNSVGGVPVEYMFESEKKAWVRFRYPRWMYHGPTICGIPVDVSRGFLRGWYAQNGVSLNNPRLGFVCVSEDMTGDFGLCGYFREFDFDLSPEQRLQFKPDERPPNVNAAEHPVLPSAEWSDKRLEKANRNYAMEYVRNGILTLGQTIGPDEAVTLASRAARLIGLQYMQETCQMIGAVDGDVSDAASYLGKMMTGMGDNVTIRIERDSATVTQQGLKIVRDLDSQSAHMILECWQELWVGALRSFQQIKKLDAETGDGFINWHICEIH